MSYSFKNMSNIIYLLILPIVIYIYYNINSTPVTAESFAKWRSEKLAKRQADAEARMKLEQAKKKGSKGLCKFNLFVYIIFTSSSI